MRTAQPTSAGSSVVILEATHALWHSFQRRVDICLPARDNKDDCPIAYAVGGCTIISIRECASLEKQTQRHSVVQSTRLAHHSTQMVESSNVGQFHYCCNPCTSQLDAHR
mmetsp:Transcript_50029/g.115464  ORF Transcript_50029/g.115464 Transcript_50029/m.115464 type:complete len:110 (-) Transcript_50029:70-399(-)